MDYGGNSGTFTVSEFPHPHERIKSMTCREWGIYSTETQSQKKII